MFQIVTLPSGGMLIKGRITQKKLTAKAKRQILLCFPSTVQDVEFIFQELRVEPKGQVGSEEMEEMTRKDMEVYGHLALSSISGFPLLVIGSNARNYIHFSQIQELYDEEDLKQACSFTLVTNQQEYRFFAGTSTDYQKWVGALSRALESCHGRETLEQYRPTTPMIERAMTPINDRAMSVMSRDPEEYVEEQRFRSMNRSSSRNPAERRRSFSSFLSKEKLGSFSNSSQPDVRQANRKKSFIGKLKSLFVSEGDVAEEERGRPQENLASKLRRRSKSVTRFLFGNSEE